MIMTMKMLSYYPDTLFVRVINNELQRMIKTATMTDNLVKNISDVLSKKGIPPIRSSLSDWKIEDRMLFYQERCYIRYSTKKDATFQKITKSGNQL